MDPFPASRAEAVRIGRERGEALGVKVLPEGSPRRLQPVVDKFFYGRRYLNRAFFERVVETFRHRLEWVVAYAPSGEPIAGAFNAARGPALYGRYWGATEVRPFLHFNVCFYFGIEECIRRGLKKFEPGAGGEHKVARGFEPTVTYSSHFLRHKQLDGAVREFLAREREAVNEHVAAARADGVLRPFQHADSL
jgi:predicted N-acyltransferase